MKQSGVSMLTESEYTVFQYGGNDDIILKLDDYSMFSSKSYSSCQFKLYCNNQKRNRIG